MALTTEITPRVHLSAEQVLQDEHRMKRLTAAFCTGIFVFADEPTATRIIDESIKICGPSPETLSQVLQSKFFAEHTPFYWAIISRHSNPGTPPLLAKLLAVCVSPLKQETQLDILRAFYIDYDSDLYLAIQDQLPDVTAHVPYNASFFDKEEDRPVFTARLASPKEVVVALTIPKFLDRLMVDKEISLEFLALGTRWCLRVSQTRTTQGAIHCDPCGWTFKLTNVGAVHQTKRLHVRFRSPGESGENQFSIGTACYAPSPITLNPDTCFLLSRFNNNPYTLNKGRALSGVITITED